jgi:hypothetical protein
VHVIHGSPQQRRNVEEALWQWKFKPPRVNDESVELETGLVFRFGTPQTAQPNCLAGNADDACSPRAVSTRASRGQASQGH